MSRPRPLFIMGNKRSGSTILVNLLNTHPNIFLSHEADTVWILHQAVRQGMPASFRPHPLDSEMEMDSTLKKCRRIFTSGLSERPTREEVQETFHRVQERLMKSYFSPSLRERVWRIFQEVGRRPKPRRLWGALVKKRKRPFKKNLEWVGDKKHVQHVDPEVRSFLRSYFPDARYIHIVRHPRGVVASMVDASKHWLVMPDYFRDTAQGILEQWAAVEEWVLEAKEREPGSILTVRLEDLCADVSATMAEVFDFLGVGMTDEVASGMPLLVHYKDPNEKYASFALPDSPRASRIMKLYGYEADGAAESPSARTASALAT